MPKIGYQKRDFTSKPVRQQPKHSPGPFKVQFMKMPAVMHIAPHWQIRDATDIAILCIPNDGNAKLAEDNAKWICDLMNKAHTVESNIAANNAALSKPMKVLP